MLKGKFTQLIPMISLVLTILLLSACNKEPEEIGLDLQPESEELRVGFFDTTSIVTYSENQDSVRTSFTSHSIVGTYVDPIFGKTSASIYTQLGLSSSGVDFGANPELDSITLQMIYAGYYGDESTRQNLEIYEMDEALSTSLDSTYYSNQELDIKDDKKYLDYTFDPSPNDSIWVDSTTSLSPRLSVNLSNEFGNKFLNASEDELADSESFNDFFYGLYMTSTKAGGGNGALLYFDLINTESYVRLYYHNDEEDSLYYDFEISSYTPRYINYRHKYTHGATHFRQQVLNKDTAMGQEKFYLQGTGGISARIHFPYLEEWMLQEDIAINEAKLIFTPQFTEGDPGLPEKLAMVAIDQNGDQYLLDDQLEGDTYYGGVYDDSNGQYFFRITRYVQSLVNRQETLNPYGLQMVVSGGAIFGNRAVINGPENENNPIKLEVTYSKIN